ELPQDYEHADSLWAINRIINEAINLSVQAPTGPVHINAPFREPLYPDKDQDAISYSDVRIIDVLAGHPRLSPEAKDFIRAEWRRFPNVLLVGAQHVRDERLLAAVSSFRATHHVPVVHDIISNLHEAGHTIQHSDLFLGHAS